jgi:hypothetical protein
MASPRLHIALLLLTFPAFAAASDEAPFPDAAKSFASMTAAARGLRRSFAQAPPAAPRRLIINIDAIGEDPAITRRDEDTEDAANVSRVVRRDPGAEVILLRVGGNGDMRRQLEREMKKRPGAAVDVLIVNSHGDVGEILGETMDVYLSRERSVREAFGPVIGRFSPQGRIVFSGCEIASKGAIPEKFALMKRIARLFGLADGSLYANQQDGESWTDDNRADGEHDPGKLAQGWVKENTVYNHGYSLVVRDGVYTLVKDNMWLALGRESMSRHIVYSAR